MGVGVGVGLRDVCVQLPEYAHVNQPPVAEGVAIPAAQVGGTAAALAEPACSGALQIGVFVAPGC